MTEFALQLLSLFSIGFLGSGHCLVMCGGMASALQLSMTGSSATRRTELQLLLSLGRLTTYSLLGALVAGFGALLLASLGLALFWLKLLSGLLLLAMALYLARLWFGLNQLERAGALLWRYIQPVAKRLMPLNSRRKALAYGLCWGFLPCGLVYSALGWALASGELLSGACLMLAFGAGTLPSILLSGGAATLLSRFKNHTQVRACAALLLGIYAIYLIWLALAPRFF